MIPVVVVMILVALLALHEFLHEPLDELGVFPIDEDLPLAAFIAEVHDDHPPLTMLLAVMLLVVPVELLHLSLDPAEPLVELLDHPLDIAGLRAEFIPAAVVVLEGGERCGGGRNGRRACNQGSDKREHGRGGWVASGRGAKRGRRVVRPSPPCVCRSGSSRTSANPGDEPAAEGAPTMPQARDFGRARSRAKLCPGQHNPGWGRNPPAARRVGSVTPANAGAWNPTQPPGSATSLLQCDPDRTSPPLPERRRV